MEFVNLQKFVRTLRNGILLVENKFSNKNHSIQNIISSILTNEKKTHKNHIAITYNYSTKFYSISGRSGEFLFP